MIKGEHTTEVVVDNKNRDIRIIKNTKICKQCGESYHYCDGCGYILAHEHGYCCTDHLQANVLRPTDLYKPTLGYASRSVFQNIHTLTYIIKYANTYLSYNPSENKFDQNIPIEIGSEWLFLYVEKGDIEGVGSV